MKTIHTMLNSKINGYRIQPVNFSFNNKYYFKILSLVCYAN